MNHAALIAHLDEAAERITERVMKEMLANPFWAARFGERAEKHARQDGLYHLKYLVQALAAEDPRIMREYARWLQQVLTTRGMCTRHLADNFDRLSAAIADERWDGASAAIDLLRAAVDALRYPAGDACTLQDRAASLAVRCADQLYAAHPDWRGRERCIDDFGYHLSYCADAIALGTPTVFTSYTRWITDFLEARGIPHMAECLRVLRAEVRELLPGAPMDALFPATT